MCHLEVLRLAQWVPGAVVARQAVDELLDAVVSRQRRCDLIAEQQLEPRREAPSWQVRERGMNEVVRPDVKERLQVGRRLAMEIAKPGIQPPYERCSPRRGGELRPEPADLCFLEDVVPTQRLVGA